MTHESGNDGPILFWDDYFGEDSGSERRTKTPGRVSGRILWTAAITSLFWLAVLAVSHFLA